MRNPVAPPAMGTGPAPAGRTEPWRRLPSWTRLAPEAKVAAMVATVLAVVALPPGAYPAFAVIAALLAALLAAARVPARWLVRRAWIGLPVAAYAVLLPFVGGDASRAGLPFSAYAVAASAALVLKAVLSLLAASLVAATTPSHEILAGAGRLGLPSQLTAVAGFMLRYLDLVVDDLQRTRTAMAARGYRARGIADARLLTTVLGHLFLRTLERGERVYLSMRARGYRGRLPRHEGPTARARDWVVAAVPAAAAWACCAGSYLVR